MRHANLNRMSFCIRSKGEVRNVSKNSRHPWFCCEPRASGVSSVFRARRYNVTTRVNATVMHASVGSRVMHASRARPYVPSDSERRRGRDASDPGVALEDEEGDEEDEHDDDDRTLAEVLGDVQASANMVFSRRDIARAETKLRALAHVRQGPLSEETLDEHLDETLEACRRDEALGDRRLVFTAERKERLRVRLHETLVRPPMRGVGSGGAQAPRDSVAARARKTELQRERRRHARERRHAGTPASSDTPAGVSLVIVVRSTATGDRTAPQEVVLTTTTEVVPAAVANAAEEENSNARRSVTAPRGTSIATPVVSALPPVGLTRDVEARSTTRRRTPFRVPWMDGTARPAKRGAANEPVVDAAAPRSLSAHNIPIQNVAAPTCRVEDEPLATSAPARRIVAPEDRGFHLPPRAAARGRGARGSVSSTPVAPFKNPVIRRKH